MLLSTDNLNARLASVTQAWCRADQTLEVALRSTDDRERLVLRCLIVRDLHHLLELEPISARPRLGVQKLTNGTRQNP